MCWWSREELAGTSEILRPAALPELVERTFLVHAEPVLMRD
ncbi:hypothetical protein [Gimesia sp.]|nr:hypothetical protein [Gimesia sp.]